MGDNEKHVAPPLRIVFDLPSSMPFGVVSTTKFQGAQSKGRAYGQLGTEPAFLSKVEVRDAVTGQHEEKILAMGQRE